MKSYKIMRCDSYNWQGEVICYVSSKKKAVEYIKSCLGILVNENNQNWSCDDNKGHFKHNNMKCLSVKEILKWEYHGKTCLDNYYVEEIEIL